MKKIIILSFIISFTSSGIFAVENKGETQSPFELDWLTDGIIVGSGALIFASELLVKNNVTQTPASQVDPSYFNLNNINAFDRWAAMPYNKGLDLSSDILLVGLLAVPATLAIGKSWSDIGIIAAMYAQTIFLSYSVKELVKASVIRYRPYNYFSNPDPDFNNSDSADSFLSGHTALAFSSAAFITTVFSSYYPDSPWSYVIGGGSFAIAATVSVLRLTAGKHFLSDVLAGAATGTLIGWFIPVIHKIRKNGGPEINLYTDIDSNLCINYTLRF